MKQRGYVRPTAGFKDIHMPHNTAAGAILALFSTAFSVAMIWYIWWLAVVGAVGVLAVAIGHTFNYKRDFFFSKDDVARIEDRRTSYLQDVKSAQ